MGACSSSTEAMLTRISIVSYSRCLQALMAGKIFSHTAAETWIGCEVSWTISIYITEEHMCDGGILRVLSTNQSFWITCLVVDFSMGVKTWVLPMPAITGLQMSTRKAVNLAPLLFWQRSFLCIDGKRDKDMYIDNDIPRRRLKWHRMLAEPMMRKGKEDMVWHWPCSAHRQRCTWFLKE